MRHSISLDKYVIRSWSDDSISYRSLRSLRPAGMTTIDCNYEYQKLNPVVSMMLCGVLLWLPLSI